MIFPFRKSKPCWWRVISVFHWGGKDFNNVCWWLLPCSAEIQRPILLPVNNPVQLYCRGSQLRLSQPSVPPHPLQLTSFLPSSLSILLAPATRSLICCLLSFLPFLPLLLLFLKGPQGWGRLITRKQEMVSSLSSCCCDDTSRDPHPEAVSGPQLAFGSPLALLTADF